MTETETETDWKGVAGGKTTPINRTGEKKHQDGKNVEKETFLGLQSIVKASQKKKKKFCFY